MLQFSNYTLEDGGDFANKCGYTVYEHGWNVTSNPDSAGFDWNMIKMLGWSEGYPSKTNDSNLALQIESFTNEGIGNYTYLVHCRVENINLEHIYKTYTLHIHYLPCEVTSVEAWQLSPFIVYFDEARPQRMRWDHFDQFPACNYTWTYELYIIDSSAQTDIGSDEDAPVLSK